MHDLGENVCQNWKSKVATENYWIGVRKKSLICLINSPRQICIPSTLATLSWYHRRLYRIPDDNSRRIAVPSSHRAKCIVLPVSPNRRRFQPAFQVLQKILEPDHRSAHIGTNRKAPVGTGRKVHHQCILLLPNTATIRTSNLYEKRNQL